MDLSQTLRDLILAQSSVASVAEGAGIPQATLQEFVNGRPDGSFPDLRLSTVQKLIAYFFDLELRPPRMTLQAELRECDVNETPEQFRERLIETLVRKFRGTTIDGLVSNPATARNYCDLIRNGLGKNVPNFTILKGLMNVRRGKGCPVGLRTRRTRMNYANELAAVGCDMDVEEFRSLVVDVFTGMYRDMTCDELVCHPDRATDVCDVVRSRTGCPGLPDQVVINVLLRHRKAGAP